MKRSPGLAGVLSVVMPGLGHLYAGATARGFALAAVFFALLQATVREPGILIAGIPVVWLFGIVDAIRVAEETVLADAAGRAPKFGLDRRWALGLVAAGVLATLALIPGIFWVLRLWPLALVWVGVQFLRGRPILPELPKSLRGVPGAPTRPDPPAPDAPAPGPSASDPPASDPPAPPTPAVGADESRQTRRGASDGSE